MVYYAAPNCHKDSRFNSNKNGLYQDWRHHPVPSGNYTNQLQASSGAKFKFLLNVNLNFIIEHTTDTKIRLPLGQSENPGFGLWPILGELLRSRVVRRRRPWTRASIKTALYK
jgi:hypothetical protein